MSIKETVTQTAARLFDGKSQPDKIKAAIAQVQARKKEADARLQQIQGAPFPGTERNRIILEGAPADLVALDEELTLLEAETTQLDAMETQLHAEHERALVRGYPPAARKAAKALPAALDDLEAAEAALEAAKRAVADKLGEIALAAKYCRDEGPFIDADLLDRAWVAYLKKYPVASGTDSRMNARLRHGLGDDTPQPPAKFRRDAEQGEKSGRRAPSSFWDRKDGPDAAA